MDGNQPAARKKLIQGCCAAAKRIRERFGATSAAQYLIDQKLASLLRQAERDPALAAEPALMAKEIKRIFAPEEIRAHLARRRLPRIRKALGL